MWCVCSVHVAVCKYVCTHIHIGDDDDADDGDDDEDGDDKQTHFLVLHLPPADGKRKFAELLTNLEKLWEDQAAMI